jgi:hypothetical protein
MSLLLAKTVFYELVMACLFEAAPTSLSPSLVKATTDGVVLAPSEFSITFGTLPSIMATHELVVPRSIPMTTPVFFEEKLANKEFLNMVLIICLFS